jgi:hypothetical protein
MSALLKAGQRVSAIVWGERREGVVVKDQRANAGPHAVDCIVWVKWDGARKKTWMHRESLRVVALREETPRCL